MEEKKTNKEGVSQDLVPVKEIKGGTVVLEDGSLVSVLLVTSLNFALKSAEEQMATIAAFRSFLNLLEFPVQISVQSRQLDIRPYIELLENRLKDQENELIRMQTVEYISFIKNFTDSVNIMDKSFFVVVSYTPALTLAGSGFSISSLFGSSPKKDPLMEQKSFEEAKSQLEQRTNLVISGLSRAGIRLARLGTEEVLEVLYKKFNPGDDQKPINLN